MEILVYSGFLSWSGFHLSSFLVSNFLISISGKSKPVLTRKFFPDSWGKGGRQLGIPAWARRSTIRDMYGDAVKILQVTKERETVRPKREDFSKFKMVLSFLNAWGLLEEQENKLNPTWTWFCRFNRIPCAWGIFGDQDLLLYK